MARVTVEDCLDHVENRFALVMLAAKRARQLSRMNADPLVELENDKPTVVALREIAAGKVTNKNIEALAKQSQQTAADAAAEGEGDTEAA